LGHGVQHVLCRAGSARDRGVNTIATTSGTVDLSTVVPPAGPPADIDHIQKLTGALVGDLTIQVPNVSKTWFFWNNTTNAFNVYLKVTGGVARANASTPGGLVQIPQACCIEVICDGAGTLIRDDDREIGTIVMSTKGAAGPGELALDGSSKLRSAFPDLFGKQSTAWGAADGTHFTLPNLTDTNRFLRAGGGSGPAVGTYQSNQNAAHSHTVTGAPTVTSLTTDSQGSHTHSATHSGHTHNMASYLAWSGQPASNSNGAAGFGVAGAGSNVSTGTGVASITVGAAGAHTHNVTGTLGIGTLGTASSGGTEARPESAAVLMCVRY
jgi:hypothetical protein